MDLGSPFALPPGYGIRAVGAKELRESGSLMGHLVMWEKPRPYDHHRYVVSVDVSDGLGKDRSVIEVTRVGTLREPDEQVAQYVSDVTPPLELAPIIDAIGRLYCDAEGYEALCAVECNNQGIAVQNELQAHLGYANFYIWQYLDVRDPRRRFSTKVGWYTTSRTRPILLTRYHAALTTLDPISGLPDYIVHSPITLQELRDFQTEGALWEASASAGAHDDCVPPETLIWTWRGTVPISAVTTDDFVLTHTGAFRRVLRVGHRRATSLWRIDALGRPPLAVTGNHRLLVHRRWRKCLTQPPLRHDAATWLSVQEGLIARTYSTTSAIPQGVSDVASISLAEYAPPTYRVVDGQLIAMTYNGTRRNAKQNPTPATWPVDTDFCRLLGYYLAEGSCGKHSVAFSSHTRERPIRRWLIMYLRRMGLAPCEVRTSAAGWVVSAGSMPLRGYLYGLGSRARKALPMWALLLPPEKQREILIGYLLGDGCFRGQDGDIRAVTISATAAMQLACLAWRCGWPVSLRPYVGQNGHALQWALAFAGPTAMEIRAAIPKELLKAKRPTVRDLYHDQRNLRYVEGRIVGGIRTLVEQPYDGYVYNLDVDVDHSYVANGTIVHNCVMSGSIGVYVCASLHHGEREPIAEARRRHSEEDAAREALAGRTHERRDSRNTAVTADEITEGILDDPWIDLDDPFADTELDTRYEA